MTGVFKEQPKKHIQQSFQKAFDNLSLSASTIIKRRTSDGDQTRQTAEAAQRLSTKPLPQLSHSLTATKPHPSLPEPSKFGYCPEILSGTDHYSRSQKYNPSYNTLPFKPDSLSFKKTRPGSTTSLQSEYSYSSDTHPWRLETFVNGEFKENSKDDECRNSAIASEKRDIYGFKLPTQWVKQQYLDQFDTYYQPILDSQEQRWKIYLSEQKSEWPPLDSKLKRYTRKGIPNHLRGKAWFHYSGAKTKMENNPMLFDSLLKTAISMGEHNEYAEIIHRDLHRTFPDNHRFQCAVSSTDGSAVMMPESNPTLMALERVLLAYSIYSPQVGYCQSLNYIVGFFLLFLETASEEEAFWMLVVTVHDYFPENMYDVTMEGANIDQTVLMLMISERLPAVWNKIANGKSFWECEQADCLPPVTLVTGHWFLTLFINILPVE
ncbi:rab-GTPase-TBC domain-containing protein [Phycomyces blakesleeanus]